MRRRVLALLFAAALAFVIAPALAMALPRSGGSFGGRSGFRIGSPGARIPRSYSTGRGNYGGGGNRFFFFPGFGWGWGGGYGGGGGSLFGTLLMLGLVGFGTVMVVRAIRRAQNRGGWAGAFGGNDDDDDIQATPDRAYVYEIQLGLGRSARDIQQRLERFAAEGDTASEAGLAHLLQQTSLELMRSKDSIRYGSMEASGPMSFTNGETKMNAAALAERSRFQVERVRGADGKVRRSDAAAKASDEVLEYVVVTLVVASRAPVLQVKKLAGLDDLNALLGQLGGVSPSAILGLEVIWTPADPDDALTSGDLLTSYPELRSF